MLDAIGGTQLMLRKTTFRRACVLVIWGVCGLVACGDSGNGPGADAASNGNDGAAQQCGNGQTEGLEECDDGASNSDTSPDACRTDCQLAHCGDGVLDPGLSEACDEGAFNAEVPDTCRTDCTEPACGDGIVDVQSGENCDDGNVDAGDGCGPGCLVELCGNGVLDPGELCDDGNYLPGDGCSADCRSDESCGNLYLDALVGEQCDDGNARSHDGCSSGCTAEIPTWDQWTSPWGARRGHVMAHDSHRDRIVLLGGEGLCGYGCVDTWEHDGVNWYKRDLLHSPPGRTLGAMVYDSQRQVMVLFGGAGAGTIVGDTWEFDGTDWVETTPAGSPPARQLHAMVYDSQRQVVVLFGGQSATSELGDTWEYNGTTWVETTPTLSPAARSAAGMAYDAARGRTVLFGGWCTNTCAAETWEYDGASWTLMSPAASPPLSNKVSMAYDTARTQVVLLGHFVGSPCASECALTWEYNGTTWTNTTPSVVPPGRRETALTYRSSDQRVVLFGGYDLLAQTSVADLWIYDGAAWMNQTVSTSPVPRLYTAGAYDADRQVVVLFGGLDGDFDLNDTWEFDGQRWALVPTATVPAETSGHAMVYDRARQRVVRFGGGLTDSDLSVAETWEYDGVDWTHVSPAASPGARRSHKMAYDSDRQVVVLFGGQEEENETAQVFEDTWEYDGTTWSLALATAPMVARFGHTMTYDASNQRVVLVGGLDSTGSFLNDTWVYDGITWSPLSAPLPPRFGAGLSYDGMRQRVVAYGGISEAGWLGDTWELVGNAWIQSQVIGPVGRGMGAMVYLHNTRQVMHFGGLDGINPRGDTWLYSYASLWPDEVCDNGADDDADTLVDCDDPDCDGQTCGPGQLCQAGTCL